MLVDQKTEQVFVPLNDNLHSTGKLELANSKSCCKTPRRCSSDRNMEHRFSQRDGCSWSDYVSLFLSLCQAYLYSTQFEYGVSWERPDILPIWEAQVPLSLV